MNLANLVQYIFKYCVSLNFVILHFWKNLGEASDTHEKKNQGRNTYAEVY